MTRTPDERILAASPVTQPVALQHDAAGAAVPRQPWQAVVTLPGEIDVSNDGQVQDMLIRALGNGTAVLVADATGTSFCGCSGVDALKRAHRRAAAAGAQLRVAASPAIWRILELTGGDQVLDTYPTLAAALAGRPRSPAAAPPPAGPVTREVAGPPA